MKNRYSNLIFNFLHYQKKNWLSYFLYNFFLCWYTTLEAKAASNRCQQRNFFPGKCGNDGIQSCLRDFKKKTKKSHIIDQCSKCENHKSPSGLEQRLCHCSYPSASPCIWIYTWINYGIQFKRIYFNFVFLIIFIDE